MYTVTPLKIGNEKAFSRGRELERLENKIFESSLRICMGSRDSLELMNLKEDISEAYSRYIELAIKYEVDSKEVIRVNERYKRAMDYGEIRKNVDNVGIASCLD